MSRIKDKLNSMTRAEIEDQLLPVHQRKSKALATMFTIIGGGIGAYLFYLGRPNAIRHFLFFWTGVPSIIALITLFKFACMSSDVFDYKYNRDLKKIREDE